MWRTVGRTMGRIVGGTVSRTVRQTVRRGTVMTTIHAKVMVRFLFGLPDWTVKSPRNIALF